MANYYNHTVSNYFNVKDYEGFKKELTEMDGQDMFTTKDGKFCVAIDGDLYSYIEKEDDEVEYDHDDFCELIQKWITEDEIVFISSVGNEKLRYLGAECTIISKNDIKFYNFFEMMAKEFNEGESIF